MSGQDFYRIICLKRSKFVDSNNYEYLSDWWDDCYKVYWNPNRAGYTELVELAGKYTAADLFHVCGEGIDWMIMRVPRSEEIDIHGSPSCEEEEWTTCTQCYTDSNGQHVYCQECEKDD